MSKIDSSAKKHVIYTRNPIYVFYALVAIAVYVVSWLFVSRPSDGGFEERIFNLFYRLPDYLNPVFVAALVLGVIGVIIGPIIFGLIVKRRDIALRTLIAVVSSFLLSVLLMSWSDRRMPLALLSDGAAEASQRFDVIGFIFPSVIMAVTTAAVLTVALYAARGFRKWLTYVLVIVAVSLMFLVVNMPLDIVGGYAVGLFCFSLCSLMFGSIYHPINTNDLADKLRAGGLEKVTLKPAAVDARGSTPFFGNYSGGPIFVKVYNQDNNAADWLFKLVRRVRYKRLEDEVPSLTPKRAIEHEAYVTMLAKYSAGVRAPEIVGMFKVDHNSYALVIKLIDAEGLNKMDESRISDSMLEKVWTEIIKLHKARIIHKDLRTANVMVEKSTGLPWIIDFGFSESAVDQKSFYKDTVEFIASSASKVGAKRAVTVAAKSVGQDYLKQALPYMQLSALSGATTTSLKQQKGLLEEIRVQMRQASGASAKEAKKARLKKLV